MKSLIILSGLILGALIFVTGVNGGTATDRASATFVVRWYDVGAYALEGRSGVLSVEKGWRGSREINRVVYDPEKTDVHKIKKLLKKSGTYIKTVAEPEKDKKWQAFMLYFYICKLSLRMP